MIVFLIALLIFNRFGTWLSRFGFGRLPGDVRFRLLGRDIFLPFASAVVLSVLAAAITWLL
ncbi:DUF2905 domain-containing protein [Ideonella livida]